MPPMQIRQHHQERNARWSRGPELAYQWLQQIDARAELMYGAEVSANDKRELLCAFRGTTGICQRHESANIVQINGNCAQPSPIRCAGGAKLEEKPVDHTGYDGVLLLAMLLKRMACIIADHLKEAIACRVGSRIRRDQGFVDQ